MALRHYLREPPEKPGAVREAWLSALARTARRGGLFVTVCHAFVTGLDPERMEVLGEVMSEAVAEPRIAVLQVGEVAELLVAGGAA